MATLAAAQTATVRPHRDSLGRVTWFTQVSIHQMPIKDALARIFGAMDVDFEMKPDVKGKVTVELQDLSTNDALREVMLRVDAIYEQRGDKFFVRRMKQTKVDSHMPLDTLVPEYRCEGADVALAVKELLGQYGVRYAARPNVRGTVTAQFKNCKLETILNNLLKQTDSRYRYAGFGLEILTNEDYNRLMSEPPPPLTRRL